MRMAKKIGIFLFISSISLTSMANDLYAEVPTNSKSDEAGYYENEGSLVFKVRARGISTDGKQSKLPATPKTVTNPTKIGHLVENGFGLDASTSVFFNSYIALELSVGVDLLRVKNSNISNIANNYGGNPANIGKKKDLYMVPLTATGQYHIAPFGAIRPYIGGGYHGAYMMTSAKFKAKNACGPVIQAGIDFYAKDDTLITLDVKQYFLTNKVTYSTDIVNGQSVSSDTRINPLVVSIGIGFKF